MTSMRSLIRILLAAVLAVSLSVAVRGAPATAAVPLGWSGPVQVDPVHYNPSAISCPTSTFCAMVDQNGNAFVLTGSGWSAPTRIDTDILGNAIPLKDVSCTSASFCVTVDNQGRAFMFDGTHWSAPVDIDGTNTLDSVSCASSTFCIAADRFGYVMTFNGSSWGLPVLTDPGKAGGDRRISCPSSTFCALLSSGALRTFNGSTWSGATAMGLGPIIYGLSCTSSTFCVAEGANGFSGPGAQIFNGSTWTTPSGTGGGTDVSCTSSTFCTVINAGGVSTYNGSSWTALAPLASGLASVSCASSTFCTTVGPANLSMIGTRTVQDTGAAYTFNGSTWSAPVPADPFGGGMGSVSCPTTSTCVSAFTGVDASVLQDGTWTYDVYVDNASLVVNAGPSISCPTATFCAAVDFEGDIVTWNGTTWSAPVLVSNGLDSVSCPTTTFCAAVTQNGDVVTYNGATWTLPTKIDNASGLGSVSCPTTTFCAAIDQKVNVLLFNGSSWTTPTSLALGGWPGGISCTSSTFCAVVSQTGAVTFNGSSWTAPTTAEKGMAVSCTAPTFCLAVGAQKASVYNGTSWSSPTTVTTAPAVALDAVSCATESFCTVLTNAGSAFTYGGVAPLPVRTAGPSLSGTSRVGHILTCAVTYSGASSVRYAWTRNGAAIAGAAGTTYRLTLQDYKTHIGCTTQAANSTGGTTSVAASPTVLVGIDTIANRGLPQIVGTVKARKTVRAAPGSWTPTASSYSYQWLLAGKPIRGATRATFKIPRNFKHRALSVRVTAHRTGYAAGIATSKATRVR